MNDEQPMQALVPAFRSAMNALDTHLRKEGMETDLFSLYNRVRDLAQSLVAQFENALYEERNLRLELEKQQAAYQKLAVQAEYREKRELILEQAYVETQIALRREAQQQLNRVRREHAQLVEEVGELKAAMEPLKAENDQLASAVVGGEKRIKTLEAAWDDAMKAVDVTREDRNRLRMIARNRRHGLIDAGNVFAYMKAEGMLLADDLKWKGHTFDSFLEHLAALARPVDYHTGEPLTDRMATAQQLNDEGAILPLATEDTSQHPEVVAVAEQLGYSKRSHYFVKSEQGSMFCARCGQDKEGAKEFCGAEEADENGVHLGAQITSVAEAIDADLNGSAKD